MTSPVSAQCVQSNDVSIYYANGMFVEFEYARISAAYLRKKLSTADIPSTVKYNVSLSYNMNETFDEQIVQVVKQKGVDFLNSVSFWLQETDYAPGWFIDAMHTLQISADVASYVRDADLQAHVSSYANDIKNGKHVIIVSHSQGNFYANRAYSLLNSPALRIVAVATPSNYTAGNGPHVSLTNDAVISRIPAARSQNTTNILHTGDQRGHSFIGSYMMGDVSGPKILAHVNTSITCPPMPPTITLHPKDTLVSEGETAIFIVAASGVGLSYQWIAEGPDFLDTISGTDTLRVYPVTQSLDGTSYRVEVSNDFGTVSSYAANLWFRAPPSPSLFTPRSELLTTGENIFETNCSGCHGQDGRNMSQPVSPVGYSDFFMNNRRKAIATVLNGGKALKDAGHDSILVNGIWYEPGSMPPMADLMSDVEIASVLTYIRVVLNDSLTFNCQSTLGNPSTTTCDRNPRDASDIAQDSVAVWEVKEVRDSLATIE